MKEKTKQFLKKYLIGFILGVVSVGIVAVYAETYFPSNDVTYDNTESGLASTNVQGAIDELYGVCFPPKAGDQIIEDAGLEKDPYECRYFFTGANPNNYITFNGETAGWRIISVECDGTIKIMRILKIGNKAWDTSRNNNWARPATLNTYLNEDYYNGLNATAKKQVVIKEWSIGGVRWENNDLEGQINDENSAKWNGKIALPTVSEYLRTNSNKSNCGTIEMNNNNYRSCGNTGWMDINIEFWTLSPYAGQTEYVLFVSSYENISNFNSDNSDLAIKPSLYLSSDVKITGGDGSQNNPYTLE